MTRLVMRKPASLLSAKASKLLLIEPNLVRANQLSEILEGQGWHVKHHSSIQDAIPELLVEQTLAFQAVLISDRLFERDHGMHWREQDRLAASLAEIIRNSTQVVLLDDDFLYRQALLN